jgi:hypothetical protein
MVFDWIEFVFNHLLIKLDIQIKTMVESTATQVITNISEGVVSKDLLQAKNIMIAANANTVFNAVSY